MQENAAKTPCRRIGLRKIPSASSKSEPRSTQSFCGGDETPKSRQSLTTNKRGRLGARCFSEGSRTPVNFGSPLLNKVVTVDTASHSDHSSQLKRMNAEENLKSKCKQVTSTITKKQKVDSADQTHADNEPTIEDLNSLRKRIVQKEKQLQELHQAQVICKKVSQVTTYASPILSILSL